MVTATFGATSIGTTIAATAITANTLIAANTSTNITARDATTTSEEMRCETVTDMPVTNMNADTTTTIAID